MSVVNENPTKSRALFTRLRERRRELDVSLSDLARFTGLSKAYVSLLERGERDLSPDLYADLTEALHDLVREREARAPAVKRAVSAAFQDSHLVALRQRHGLSAKQGRDELQDLRMDARHG